MRYKEENLRGIAAQIDPIGRSTGKSGILSDMHHLSGRRNSCEIFLNNTDIAFQCVILYKQRVIGSGAF